MMFKAELSFFEVVSDICDTIGVGDSSAASYPILHFW
jgi:hypothetical protein